MGAPDFATFWNGLSPGLQLAIGALGPLVAGLLIFATLNVWDAEHRYRGDSWHQLQRIDLPDPEWVSSAESAVDETLNRRRYAVAHSAWRGGG